jgi:3-methyladenine DNA glycosylase AlkD
LTVEEVLANLRRHADPRNIEGMARYGINAQAALGVAAPRMKAIARRAGKDHELAQKLWATGVREARHIAAWVDDPSLVTPGQMDRWARDFDSWDIVDGVCGHLFVYAPSAWKKALQWPHRKEEFVRRAGFTMMAWLAVHDKESSDEAFQPCFALIEEYASDDRNFVKKAVNWALRQIGKRSPRLRKQALEVAARLKESADPSARWIGADALRELKSRAAPAPAARPRKAVRSR